MDESRSEGSLGELGAIDAEVGIENSAAEVANHLVVNGLAGEHQFVGDAIGLHEMRAQGDKHFADNRFARGDAAGEADFQQIASG